MRDRFFNKYRTYVPKEGSSSEGQPEPVDTFDRKELPLLTSMTPSTSVHTTDMAPRTSVHTTLAESLTSSGADFTPAAGVPCTEPDDCGELTAQPVWSAKHSDGTGGLGSWCAAPWA